MSRTLYLFSGLTPNIKGHPYFNIKNFNNYLTYLQAHYTLVKTITPDNYRINALTCKITATGLSNYNITYAIENDSVTGYHRAYFIDSVNEQSNMLYLNLSIDYWGSYYLARNIDYLHIIQCNRNIGIGSYLNIKNTKSFPQQEFLNYDLRYNNNYYVNTANLYLVFQIVYNAQEWITGNISDVSMYAISLKKIYDNYIDMFQTKGLTFNLSIGEMIVDFLTGINGVTSTLGTNKAKVLKAYILPSSLIALTGFYTWGSAISFYCSYTGDNQTLHYITDTKYFNVKQQTLTLYNQITTTANYNYLLGTYNNIGLELPRLTRQNRNVYFICNISIDSIKVFVQEGNSQKEITTDFEIVSASNDNYTGELQGIAKALSYAGNTMIASLKAYSKGGTGLALATAGISLFGQLGTQEGLGITINSSGNAIINYDLFNDYVTTSNEEKLVYVRCPFCLNKYLSFINEEERARVYGATFDEQYENINYVFGHDFIGSADYDLTLLICDDIKINNMPTNARVNIENAFKNGVELLDYE